MSVARGGHPIDADRERELTALLDNEEFAKAVSAYDREDDTHEVPYGGGSSIDGRMIYWDRRVSQAIASGQFRLGGKPIDPRPTGKVHEAVEGAALRLLKVRYLQAHDLADVAERHAVAHHGWNWDEYQAEWKRLIDPIEKAPVTDPPRDLLLDPYRGTKLYGRLLLLQKRAIVR